VQKTQRTQKLHDFADLTRRKLSRIRITVKESLIRGRNEIRSRPLQQQLRDQYPIRIPRASPREVAAVTNEPTAHPAAKPSDVRGRGSGSRSSHRRSLGATVQTFEEKGPASQ
jgi:hypothetical protein